MLSMLTTSVDRCLAFICSQKPTMNVKRRFVCTLLLLIVVVVVVLLSVPGMTPCRYLALNIAKRLHWPRYNQPWRFDKSLVILLVLLLHVVVILLWLLSIAMFSKDSDDEEDNTEDVDNNWSVTSVGPPMSSSSGRFKYNTLDTNGCTGNTTASLLPLPLPWASGSFSYSKWWSARCVSSLSKCSWWPLLW